MNFRKTMDNTWLFMYYINFLFIGFVSIGHVVIPIDVTYYIILISYAVISFSFTFYYSKTIDIGHEEEAVRIFKPSISNSVAINHEKQTLWLIFGISVFCVVMFFVMMYSDKYRSVSFVLMFILLIISFIVYLSFSSSTSVKSRNNFIRLILTKSKLKLYSPGFKIREFSRSLLKFDFVNEYELILTSVEHDSEIIVNIWQLPEDEKQELRSLLAQNSQLFTPN